MNIVRVRFAPSPTGPLHIGGLRTALFNYLFAKKNNGTFILRIEDTDQTRYVAGAEQYIIDSLRWCGLQIDEGVVFGGPYAPYRQSERKDIYKKYAFELLQKNHAYYAFDTAETLDALRKEYETKKETFAYDSRTRLKMKNSLSLSTDETQKLLASGTPYVIRFKTSDHDENISFTDAIRGEVSFQSHNLDDKILFKSDGMPTYHLANVVDDHLMQISHVIRGEEWLPSTPLHILLYRAFGWENSMPCFAHLPLILKPSGQGKLSKRDGDKLGFPVFPLQWTDPQTGEISSGYRETGYLPEAVINILAFLGWNPGNEQELFSLDELIAAFDLNKIGKAGARFDPEKARWYNQQYLRKKSNAELADILIQELHTKNINCSREKAEKVLSLIRERISFTHEIWQQSSFFFLPPESYENTIVKKNWNTETPAILEDVKKVIHAIEPFGEEHIEWNMKNFITTKQVKEGYIMNILRLCLVGSSSGPHLYSIMTVLGKEETILRIDKALVAIQKT